MYLALFRVNNIHTKDHNLQVVMMPTLGEILWGQHRESTLKKGGGESTEYKK